ncbi:MAG: hypothetical protein IKB34_00720 [Clostridia bacterium]|nr:hypothetical protein [Clostridia bacterium]
MVRYKRSFAIVALSFMLCILSIGYAAVSDTLVVIGQSTLQPPKPEGLYILKVELQSENNATSVDFEHFTPTNMKAVIHPSGQNASIIYKITVKNASTMTYRYSGVVYDRDLDSNNYIGAGITISTYDNAGGSLIFDSSDTVEPNEERVFYAKYTFVSGLAGYTFTLTVNFDFSITIDGIHSSLLEALNNPTTYQTIEAAFDAKYSQTGETVIGNIGDTSNADAQFISELFGDNPTINIDGVDVPVKIMIRRDNIDGSVSSGDGGEHGPPGSEYTIYITTDELDGNGNAVMYAISNSKGEDGKWHQLGQLYEGTVTVQNGNVDPDSWRATENTYYIGNISYKVGVAQHGNGINDIKTLEQLMQIDFNFDRETGNAIRSGLLSNVRAIIYGNNVDKTTEEYLMLRQAFEEAECCYILQNNGNGIDLNWGISRAEAVPHLIKLWEAYDNYRALHP